MRRTLPREKRREGGQKHCVCSHTMRQHGRQHNQRHSDERRDRFECDIIPSQTDERRHVVYGNGKNVLLGEVVSMSTAGGVQEHSGTGSLSDWSIAKSDSHRGATATEVGASLNENRARPGAQNMEGHQQGSSSEVPNGALTQAEDMLLEKAIDEWSKLCQRSQRAGTS